MITAIKGFVGQSEGAVKFYFMVVRFGKLIRNDLVHIQKLLLFLKVFPYTMVGYERLSNVYELALEVERKRIQGGFLYNL